MSAKTYLEQIRRMIDCIIGSACDCLIEFMKSRDQLRGRDAPQWKNVAPGGRKE